MGEAANRAKSGIEGAVAARLAALDEAALSADLARIVDVTLPARGRALGTLHPLTLVRREIEQIFLGLGFEVRTGPLDRDRVEQLRRAQHAARSPRARHAGHLLRRGRAHPALAHLAGADPHHAGRAAAGADRRARQRLPARRRRHPHADVPPDARGCCVDEASPSPTSRATLLHFVQRFFGPELGLRLRPSFFPFTEPSAEVDADCYLCEGGRKAAPRPAASARASGWIEIGGAGMVHPNVFRAVGYDTREVSGFAFGVGLSRMAMLKYGVDDLRSFYENDVRFLSQFR